MNYVAKDSGKQLRVDNLPQKFLQSAMIALQFRIDYELRSTAVSFARTFNRQQAFAQARIIRLAEEIACAKEIVLDHVSDESRRALRELESDQTAAWLR